MPLNVEKKAVISHQPKGLVPECILPVSLADKQDSYNLLFKWRFTLTEEDQCFSSTVISCLIFMYCTQFSDGAAEIGRSFSCYTNAAATPRASVTLSTCSAQWGGPEGPH